MKINSIQHGNEENLNKLDHFDAVSFVVLGTLSCICSIIFLIINT